MTIEADPFFSELANPQQGVRRMASEVACRLLIWMADGQTLHERGLRTSVALSCIWGSPDGFETLLKLQILSPVRIPYFR